MKSLLILAIAAGSIAAAPAAEPTFATWQECMDQAVDLDPSDQWLLVCVASGDGGWKLAWSNLKRAGKRR